MEFNKRKYAFLELGRYLAQLSGHEKEELISRVAAGNQWFTPHNIACAIDGLAALLRAEDFEKWLSRYEISDSLGPAKKVGIIMAGNIPCVGFHDALCVLLSGHTAKIKLSSDDAVFPKIIFQKLVEIAPEFQNAIVFQEQMKDVDALIATGSDNSARYFEYYFAAKPHIIRKNRTSVAILDGNEAKEDLKALGNDIFTYFGLGCRNVSKIFIPQGYDLAVLFEAMYEFHAVVDNKKYANNYEYHRAIMLMNSEAFLDNNFIMLKESKELVSPVSVLYYQTYESVDEVLDYLNVHAEKIQCVVSRNAEEGRVGFGQTQQPRVWDYADNVDTMQFLLGIYSV